MGNAASIPIVNIEEETLHLDVVCPTVSKAKGEERWKMGRADSSESEGSCLNSCETQLRVTSASRPVKPKLGPPRWKVTRDIGVYNTCNIRILHALSFIIGSVGILQKKPNSYNE